MSCCNLATFMVLCWTTEPGNGDWPSHRVSAGGINSITWAWVSYNIWPSSQFEGKINPSLILHYSIHYPPNHGHQIYLAEVLAGCHSTVAAMSTNQLDPREGKFRPFAVLGLAAPDPWKFAEWWHLHSLWGSLLQIISIVGDSIAIGKSAHLKAVHITNNAISSSDNNVYRDPNKRGDRSYKPKRKKNKGRKKAKSTKGSG